MIKTLREAGIQLPISSYIHCAVSAGSDSMALALLLARYGRRVVGEGGVRLIHVNHGWRGAESEGDAAFVKAFAQRLKVPIKMVRLKTPRNVEGESLEAWARTERKEAFRKISGGEPVLTAHHADDLAETLLWRLFTGQSATHGGGIAVVHEQHGLKQIRPLLRIRKEELQEFLIEEGQAWREDRTNHEGRFLRSRMRQVLMPEIQKIFPRAIEHLVEAGLRAQRKTQKQEEQAPLERVLRAEGLRLKREHLERLYSARWQGEVSLPNGWKLSHKSNKMGESWVLEKKPG
jgi:tRNA(Ile)-lysidine synthase